MHLYVVTIYGSYYFKAAFTTWSPNEWKAGKCEVIYLSVQNSSLNSMLLNTTHNPYTYMGH